MCIIHSKMQSVYIYLQQFGQWNIEIQSFTSLIHIMGSETIFVILVLKCQQIINSTLT